MVLHLHRFNGRVKPSSKWRSSAIILFNCRDLWSSSTWLLLQWDLSWPHTANKTSEFDFETLSCAWSLKELSHWAATKTRHTGQVLVGWNQSWGHPCKGDVRRVEQSCSHEHLFAHKCTQPINSCRYVLSSHLQGWRIGRTVENRYKRP